MAAASASIWGLAAASGTFPGSAARAFWSSATAATIVIWARESPPRAAASSHRRARP
ncbi:MAG: hypothetical protein IPG75_15615 [Gemmatimonadetes bacterium]|nr:hypothetical protein [Gemmatimonadota bacterium]